MYIPKRYQITDVKEVKRFIEKNSFGIIVTQSEHKPIATHVPLLLNQAGDTDYLTTHLAIGNPQWQSIKKEPNQNVLVIFPGPHTYISSSWYENENVPTWNYQAVHVYGKANIMDPIELEADLSNLLQKYEGHRENPVLWEKLSERTKRMKNAVVGLKITITEIEAAYKLSQNRNDRDYANIIAQLLQAEDADARTIAKEMKRMKEKRTN